MVCGETFQHGMQVVGHWAHLANAAPSSTSGVLLPRTAWPTTMVFSDQRRPIIQFAGFA